MSPKSRHQSTRLRTVPVLRRVWRKSELSVRTHAHTHTQSSERKKERECVYKCVCVCVCVCIEICTLLDIWVKDTPSVKILYPQKLSPCTFVKTLHWSIKDALMFVPVSCEILYRWTVKNCCFVSESVDCICLHNGAQLKSEVQHRNLIGLSMTASSTVLSPSSIFPPPSPHFAFVTGNKNSACF
jgi:hypothetical protein